MLVFTAATGARAHPSALEQIEHLSAAIRARPDDPLGYIRRGQAYSNEGHYDEALADYQKAAQLGDPVAGAYDLGVLYYRMGRLDEARREFDRWLERHPGHAPALEYRARVARDAGRPEAALADFRAYFEAQPNPNPGDYLSAAELLAGLEGEGTPAALSMLDAGMARLGTIPQLQQRAIELERARGDLDRAIARLEALRPSLGRSPDWKVDMGELLIQSGRPSQAIPHLDAAEAQLAASRSTAARVRLQARLTALQASLEDGAVEAAARR